MTPTHTRTAEFAIAFDVAAPRLRKRFGDAIDGEAERRR